jgi:MYXO-CTERM domain-containing protein
MRTALLLVLVASSAAAQTRIQQDTLSADAPGVLVCGFCETERFGTIFRELPPPLRGLQPSDFPLTLESVEIALGSAVGGASCMSLTTGGMVMAPIEIYAGSTPPTGSITALPTDAPWPGETLVWAAEAPIQLSVADGAGNYALNFNSLHVRDETAATIRVPAGNSYLRVVVTLPAGSRTSATCTASGVSVPDAFPFNDNGLVNERAFIYAVGVGWLWNEQARVAGDWSLRLTAHLEGTDAGTPTPDAGVRNDAGVDAGMDASTDGGTIAPAGGGCGCRAASTPSFGVLWVFALVFFVRRRR